MQSLRWDDLRVLLALLETRSLSGAGTKLGLNASTISRRLESLEASVGAHLFDRTPEGVVPTAVAEALGPHAEAMERAASGLTLAAEGRETQPEGEVRLAASPSVGQFLVAPALPRLFRRHPGLRVSLDERVAQADLTRREADLALRMGRPTAGDLLMKKLGEVTVGVYGVPRYAAELGTLRRLDKARWITWVEEVRSVAGFLEEKVPAERIVLRANTFGTQLAAASAGVGVLLCNPLTARAHGLVEVPLSPALARSLPYSGLGSLYLVVHRALREVPRIAAVWRFLEETARGVRF